MWDSWFFKQGADTHAFYLQALPTDNPYLKHDNRVTIGHAVSQNLTDWKELPTVLEPGSGDTWDNLALWTGSAIERDGTFYMFYTGRNSEGNKMWIQRIGLATTDSKDLTDWKKYEKNPVLEAREFYEIDNYKNKLGKIGAWRDPFVFYHPTFKKYFMTISARVKGEKKEYNGCAALASSDNLLEWKLEPPVFAPRIYDEIECTQVVFHHRKWYLFFSTHAANYEPEFAKKIGGPVSGLHGYFANDFFGPYLPVNGNGVVLANGEEMYDVRLIKDKSDDFFALGWLKTKEEKYSGKLSLPFKITIKDNRVSRV